MLRSWSTPVDDCAPQPTGVSGPPAAAGEYTPGLEADGSPGSSGGDPQPTDTECASAAAAEQAHRDAPFRRADGQPEDVRPPQSKEPLDDPL